MTEPENFASDIAISSIADNVVALRFVEVESGLKRSLIIFKARATMLEGDIREFEITSKGMVVREKLVGVEGLMEGIAKKSLPDDLAASLEKSLEKKA